LPLSTDSFAIRTFLPMKATAASSALMPRARAARDDAAWLHMLEEALDAPYDGHTPRQLGFDRVTLVIKV
jgi:hypothetical protein